ncbi:LytR/AlgR family response regulator transcription factor [Emticicia soli]|uniref:LytR/AlgR family response regulator transcription factor n=1 Tax=Emticicia soli TaxID=2027878 RepID=A0ABW5JCC7_9BACT
MEQKKILLVEDDFLNRRLSKKVLLENGFAVLEAKNAKEALEILKREAITIAILDIHLGENEQDGISLGQQIKDKYAVPFIYLTAYANVETIGKAIATSPFSYLTKPFKSSDLIASVEITIRQAASMANYQPKLVVKDGEYSVELAIDEINYIESDGNYLVIHTDGKKYKVRSTIKKMIEELSASIFVQTHRAYIVNKNKIRSFNSKKVMIGDTAIPVSDNYADGLS